MIKKPQAESMIEPSPKGDSLSPSIVIIGAGMTGILLVIKLRAAGYTNITIFEKKERLGGTWRENTYPGVACDVPAHLYTYSFEANPDWSHIFAPGSEIQHYFEQVAKKYGVTEVIHFNESVTDAIYDPADKGSWLLKTSQQRCQKADILICATGILHHPALPNIQGIDDFKGSMFHTAEWDHSVTIGPKTKVAVIGTGSTASQVIPELINSGAEVSIFQRTPQWIIPTIDFSFSERTKTNLKNKPQRMARYRMLGQLLLEHFFTKAVTGHFIPKLILEFVCKTNLRFSIKSTSLRQKLTPNYQVGCKRVIFNRTYYSAIQKDNAQLITDNIQLMTKAGIITRDSNSVESLHQFDVIVLSTGFHPFNFMRPMNLVGRDELHIDDAWSKKISTYRSLLIPKFPNLFLMLGPNTPIGNFSVIAMSEVQTNYIIQLIQHWENDQLKRIEAKELATEDFNYYIKAGLKNTSWVGGCKSWYLDSDGTPILWPYTWQRWVDEMESPDLNDYMTTVDTNTQLKVLDPQQKKIATWLDKLPAPSKFSPKMARINYLLLEKLFGIKKEPLERIDTRKIQTSSGEQLKLRVYYPNEPSTSKEPSASKEPSQHSAMVYYHGGGGVIGSIETHDHICRFLATYSKVIIISVDYRLAPKSKFPAAIIDAIDSWNWVNENAAMLGLDENNIGIGGDSAGAYLAAIVGLNHLHKELPVSSTIKPKYQYLLYPMTDLSTDFSTDHRYDQGLLLTTDFMKYFGRHFLSAKDDIRNPLISLNYVTNLEQSPKTYLLTVEFDPLNEQGCEFANKLAAANVAVNHEHFNDCMHGFISLASASSAALRASHKIANRLSDLAR